MNRYATHGELTEDGRYCVFCDTSVRASKWADHLTSQAHDRKFRAEVGDLAGMLSDLNARLDKILAEIRA